ncbi:MAG: hypothetical protein JRE40_02275 [Deltaproteobacteria bacterium]|nr:hypothetical protein [Deltaproteobacteria bacterium]
MNSYSRIIKARDVKLTDLQEETSTGFVRGHYSPAEDCKVVARQTEEGPTPAEEEIVGGDIAEIKAARKKAEQQEAAEKKAYEEVMEDMDLDKRNLSMALESVAKLIRELGALKEKLLERSEQEILDLVFLVAGKVIHKEVSADREVILSVLRDAMRSMRGKEDVRVRMNPEDYRYITETNPDFLGSYGEVSIEKDEEIGRGGAVVEAHSGVVDARLDQQLDKVRDGLYDEHRF